MILYKHGVGFFERYGQVDQTQVELTFKKDEMNDVLKSLAVFPQGDGQVINISYETPEEKQVALENAPIVLSNDAALLDLLRSLRGRAIRLHLMELDTSYDTSEDEQDGNFLAISGTAFDLDGIFIGLDIASDPNKTRLSIATTETIGESSPSLRTFLLPQVQGMTLLDAQSGEDLRYVLELSRAREDQRSLTILLNQPDQPLLVNYIAPTPTWRVSYRLVYTPESPQSTTGQFLLQGWGIIDNQLDEDLEEVHLTLIAGQPISFIYDLYTPRFIERPQVTDEERTVTGPVMFDQALPATAASFTRESFEDLSYSFECEDSEEIELASVKSLAAPRRDLAAATKVQTTGIAKGELFEYRVNAPISIKRGQSAMVPILGATLDGRKEHIYNGEKVPVNPVVTITATNTTGLTLERGPVTVLEDGNYVGEAVIAFTPTNGEFFIPYAVDLGVRVTETYQKRLETTAIRLSQSPEQTDYFIRDEYDIRQVDYQVDNRNPEPLNLVIEQRIQPGYSLFDTPEPEARTADFYRWRLQIAERSTAPFRVQTRQLTSRQKALKDLSYSMLEIYLRDRVIDNSLFEDLSAVLDLYNQIQQNQKSVAQKSRQREQLEKEQQQLAQKIQPLGRERSEGDLRRRYVTKMNALEDESEQLSRAIASLEANNAELHNQIHTQLQTLVNPSQT
jgi:uncharacterized protein YukE